MSLFLLLVVLRCFIGVVEAAVSNIAQNDWAILKSFFSAANCKTEFCNALSNNQTCLLPIVCDAGGNVLQLQLNNYNLSGSLISEIAQLKQLQSLVLSNNRFNSTIPSEIAQLSSLTLLDLSNNSFVGSVPAEFDRSNLKQVSLHGNLLSGYVPFFPLALNCSLQLVNDGNMFCCPKFLSQICCGANNCLCSFDYAGCSKVAPVPPRCDLLDDNGPNHALCMTASTSFAFEQAAIVTSNFTIAFWAKARERLDYTRMVALSPIVDYPSRGLLFFPWYSSGQTYTVGLYLGADGLAVFAHRQTSVYFYAPVVVFRWPTPTFQWHHYTISVANNLEIRVYIDGNGIDSALVDRSIDNSTAQFYFILGHPRVFSYNQIVMGERFRAFEGWLSDLRIANYSMNGTEALRQSNNASAWQSSFPMQGCAGENHTATEIERIGSLQQAWLVCRQPFPTCGTETDSFKDWEPAGCLCEDENQTRTCVNGYYSQDSDAIMSTRPEVYWRLDGNSNDLVVLDSSGNGRNGSVKGAPVANRVANPDDVINGSTIFVNGGGYINFGDIQALNFGTRDFVVDFWIRSNASDSMFYGYVISKVQGCDRNNTGDFLNVWQLVVFNGFVRFEIWQTYDKPRTSLGLDGRKTRVNDNKWHFVEAVRSGATINLKIDDVFQGSATGNDIINLDNNGSVLAGAVVFCNNLGSFYTGELANISIRVGVTRRQLCSSSPSGYVASSYLQSSGCKRVVGFCSPSKQGRQCCGATNCSECSNTYRSCSRNFSWNGSTKTTSLLSTTTTSTMTIITATENSLSPSSSSSTSPTTTINSTSVAVDVGANSQVLPTVGWIGALIGSSLLCLLVGVAVASCICLRKQRSSLSPSQTSLAEFHSVKNEDESRYSAIPPKPDHPYVDASFISIAEANEEIGRAMEQEANNKKSIEIRY